MPTTGVTEVSSERNNEVPRFMRRRMELLGEIEALVGELDESLDRIERATGPASQESEPEP